MTQFIRKEINLRYLKRFKSEKLVQKTGILQLQAGEILYSWSKTIRSRSLFPRDHDFSNRCKIRVVSSFPLLKVLLFHG